MNEINIPFGVKELAEDFKIKVGQLTAEILEEDKWKHFFSRVSIDEVFLKKGVKFAIQSIDFRRYDPKPRIYFVLYKKENPLLPEQFLYPFNLEELNGLKYK